jgi:hypothetical protein
MILIKAFLHKILNKSLHLDRTQKGLLITNKIYIKSVQYLKHESSRLKMIRNIIRQYV